MREKTKKLILRICRTTFGGRNIDVAVFKMLRPGIPVCGVYYTNASGKQTMIPQYTLDRKRQLKTINELLRLI